MSQSLCFLFPFFFFFFLMDTKGDGGGSFSTNCPSQNCSGVTVSYPFWRLDNTTSSQYCGYQGFGVNCSTAGDPIFYLPGDAYYVKDIDYDNYTLSLVDIDVVNITCPRARHNLTLETLPLGYSTLDSNLSFYFNCSSPPPLASPIGCLRYGTNQSYVFVVGREPEGFDWFRHCEEKVVATVKEREIDFNGLISGFGGVMNKGFMLDWRTARECGTCEASDGRCGYNNVTTEFLCFCSDGRISFDRCNGGGLNVRLKIGIGFGAAGVAIFFTCLIFFIYHRRNKKRYTGSSFISPNVSSHLSSMTDPEKASTYLGVQIFPHSELEEATNKFDSNRELGDGGFGTVYQGKLRDGRVVAVKRLYENNYRRVRQFMNEIEILTRLRHQNLVSLYGCTTHHSHELLLVYEYIPNGTVADHLHGKLAEPGSLTWSTRMNIAIETASALSYLHASDVIHRDVKTSNILLDNNFGVKVADFGLSRLFPTDVTHVSTAPQGTPGYVDPEYHECYQLTDRSDVYSFGVVLIELISSKPAVDITRHRNEINLSKVAINKIQSSMLHELVDPHLEFESDYKVREMIHAVAELAYRCLQNGREMRPSMDDVLEDLRGIQSKDYNIENGDEVDNTEDDAVLLKNNPQIRSPDSVTVKWISSSTTSNSSTG